MPIDVQLAIEAVSKLERKVAKLRQNSTWSGVKRRRREIGKQTSQNKAYPNDRRKRHITKKVTFDMSDDQAVHVDIEDPIIRTSKMEMSKKNEPTPAQVSVESSESEESDSVPEANVLKRFPTLAPGEVNMTIGDNSDYLQTFKEACKHSKDRKKYFPLPRAVRRIKPWAGAKLPPAVERKVRAYLPEEPTAHRPFSSRKKAVC